MITVLVAADKRDRDFWSALTRLLGRHFALVRAYGQKLAAGKDNPSLVICDFDSFTAIDSKQVIIVYRQARALAARLSGAGRIVAVVDSSDDKLLEHVSSTGYPAITCGLLSRDTVTLSSMDVDSAVIDVQRSIACFNGESVEPQEIPLRFTKPVDNFVLMAVAVILILSGNAQKLLKGKM